jgi:hypothetical protein
MPPSAASSEQLQLPAVRGGEDLDLPRVEHKGEHLVDESPLRLRLRLARDGESARHLRQRCPNGLRRASEGGWTSSATNLSLVRRRRGSGLIPCAPSNSAAWASIFAPPTCPSASSTPVTTRSSFAVEDPLTASVSRDLKLTHDRDPSSLTAHI